MMIAAVIDTEESPLSLSNAINTTLLSIGIRNILLTVRVFTYYLASNVGSVSGYSLCDYFEQSQPS